MITHVNSLEHLGCQQININQARAAMKGKEKGEGAVPPKPAVVTLRDRMLLPMGAEPLR